MDVICCGMYRACSTWQYEVVGHLIEAHRRGERLGYVEGAEYRPSLVEGHWRVLKCHDRHPNFDRALDRGVAIAIYAHRDVRDVVDSMRHKTGKSFEGLMGEGLVHRILSNDRHWSGRPGVLVQRYEDLVADPTGGVAALAGRLGIEPEDGEAEAVAACYSPASNRKRAEAVREQLRARGVDPDGPGQALRYDPKTLLHLNHLRRGAVGGWREAMTAEEQATLGRIVGEWLVRHGYEPDHSWAPEPRSGAIRAILRSRWHAAVYFAARRHPGAAAVARRALGLGRPDGEAVAAGVIVEAERAPGAPAT